MLKTLLSRASLGVASIGLISLTASGVASASTPPTSQPYVVLSSYYGYENSSFTVNGYSFGDNEQVSVNFDGHMSSAETNGSGSFSDQVSVSNMQGGTYSVTATGNDYHESADANYTVGSYYGVAQPSSYYVLPGTGLSVSGKSFMPYEQVTVKDTTNGQTFATVNADSNGSFTTQSFMVPYNEANTTQSFMVTGMSSGSTYNFTVTVGTYYPQLNPSTYYVTKGSGLTVSGNNFAPFEGVRIFENGQLVSKVTAGGDGTIQNVSIPVPRTNPSFTVTATGMQVGDSVSRTISVQQK
jgi:hypothetical protein